MTKQKPDWLKMKLEEVEKIIIDLVNKGTPPEKIGLILRDNYGIPTLKVYKTKISEILKKHNINKDSEIENLDKKSKKLEAHFKKNIHDQTSKRALTLTRSKLIAKKKYKKEI